MCMCIHASFRESVRSFIWPSNGPVILKRFKTAIDMNNMIQFRGKGGKTDAEQTDTIS